MRNRQSSITLAVKSALSFFALTLATVLVHEGAHLVFAIMTKVPIESFSWFDPQYLAPGFFSGPTENVLGLTVVGYAGGLAAGAFLLTLLVLKRKWFSRSVFRWLLGCYIATLGLWQICQGILEGAFHDMYISDATNIFSLTYGIGYVSALLGIALYYISMPGPVEFETCQVEHSHKA
ncbi:MAG: hypothetical protein V3S51_03035 [Dehalococcoidia bacterium]